MTIFPSVICQYRIAAVEGAERDGGSSWTTVAFGCCFHQTWLFYVFVSCLLIGPHTTRVVVVSLDIFVSLWRKEEVVGTSESPGFSTSSFALFICFHDFYWPLPLVMLQHLTSLIHKKTCFVCNKGWMTLQSLMETELLSWLKKATITRRSLQRNTWIEIVVPRHHITLRKFYIKIIKKIEDVMEDNLKMGEAAKSVLCLSTRASCNYQLQGGGSITPRMTSWQALATSPAMTFCCWNQEQRGLEPFKVAILQRRRNDWRHPPSVDAASPATFSHLNNWWAACSHPTEQLLFSALCCSISENWVHSFLSESVWANRGSVWETYNTFIWTARPRVVTSETIVHPLPPPMSILEFILPRFRHRLLPRATLCRHEVGRQLTKPWRT